MAGSRKVSTALLIQRTAKLQQQLADLWGVGPSMVMVTIHDMDAERFDSIPLEADRWDGDELTLPYCTKDLMTEEVSPATDSTPSLKVVTVVAYCSHDHRETAGEGLDT